jgi:hypothetical protein
MEPTTDRMHMGVVETRDDRSPVSANDPCHWAAQPKDLLVCTGSADCSAGNGNRFDKRWHSICRDLRSNNGLPSLLAASRFLLLRFRDDASAEDHKYIARSSARSL